MRAGIASEIDVRPAVPQNKTRSHGFTARTREWYVRRTHRSLQSLPSLAIVGKAPFGSLALACNLHAEILHEGETQILCKSKTELLAIKIYFLKKHY
jgi:hypothetical protein